MGMEALKYVIPKEVVELLPPKITRYADVHRDELIKRFSFHPVEVFNYENWYKWYKILLNIGIYTDAAALAPAFKKMAEVMLDADFDQAFLIWGSGAYRLLTIAGQEQEATALANWVLESVPVLELQREADIHPYLLPALSQRAVPSEAQSLFQGVWTAAVQTDQYHEVSEPVFEYLALTMSERPINARIGQTLWRMRYQLTRNFEEERPQPLTYHGFALLFEALQAVAEPDLYVDAKRLPVGAPFDSLPTENVTLGDLAKAFHDFCFEELERLKQDELLAGLPDLGKDLRAYTDSRTQSLRSHLAEADRSSWRRCPQVLVDLDVPPAPPLSIEQSFPAWTDQPPRTEDELAPSSSLVETEITCQEPILPSSEFDSFGRFEIEVDSNLHPPSFPPTTDPTVWETIFDLHREIDRAELSAEELLDRSALILLRLPQDNPSVGDLFAHLQVISLWPMLGSAAAAYQEMMKVQASLPLVEVDPQWQASLLLQQASVWLRLDEHIRCCQLVDQAMSISAPNGFAIRWYGLSQQMQASIAAGYSADAMRLSSEALSLAWGSGVPWAKYESGGRFCYYADWDVNLDIAALVGALTMFMDGSHPQVRGGFVMNPMMALCEYLTKRECHRAVVSLWQGLYHFLKADNDMRMIYTGDKYLMSLWNSHSYQYATEAIKEFGKTALRKDSPEFFAQWWTKLPVAGIYSGKYGPLDNLNLVLIDSDILGWGHDVKSYAKPDFAPLYLASAYYEVGRVTLDNSDDDLSVPFKYLLQSAIYFANSDDHVLAARVLYWLAQACPIPEWAEIFVAAVSSAKHHAEQAPDLEAALRNKIDNEAKHLAESLEDDAFLEDPAFYEYFIEGNGHVIKTVDYYQFVSPTLPFPENIEL